MIRKARVWGLILWTVAAFNPVGLNAAEGATLEKVLPGTAHQAYFAMDFDGNKGIAVGAGGEIQVSSDGGKTWTPEAGPTKLALTAVAIRDGRRLAAGQMGEIFVDDGSGKWSKVESGTTERMLGATIDSQGGMMVVGAFGVMLRSTDGGKQWNSVAPVWMDIYRGSDELPDDFAPSIYGVTIEDSGTGLAVGELSTILRTTDYGTTWHAVLGRAIHGSERPPALFSVKLRPDGVGYAVGQAGLILQTPDHGKTWCSLNSGTDRNLLSVDSHGPGDTVISGIRAMLRSNDEGKSWRKIEGENISIAWYSSVAAVNSGQFVSAGQSGNIIVIR